MYKDEILEKIHKYREEYAKSFNYDLKAIFSDLRNKQIARGHAVVKPQIKRHSQKSSHSNPS
jgi:aromatic ring hydroxylase